MFDSISLLGPLNSKIDFPRKGIGLGCIIYSKTEAILKAYTNRMLY